MSENELIELVDTLIRRNNITPIRELEDFFRSTEGKYNPDQLFENLIQRTREVFHYNEKDIFNRSDAADGLLGKLNAQSKESRNKKYIKKIEKDHRSGEGNIVILAEGDSWFEYPIDVEDIIDWLSENERYAIYSLAYGGDWLANMIYEGEFIYELKIHQPEVFLISGGGNDLVGSFRLASLLKTAEEAGKSDIGKEYLNDAFYHLMNIFKVQYFFMFKKLEAIYKDMTIITQGYDYAIPDNSWLTLNPVRTLTNYFDNGKWLYKPMMIKGIKNIEAQKNILRAMIDAFNEDVMIELANYFKNVYHIDSRGLTPAKEWYNELHPKSKIFKRIAHVYEQCIQHTIYKNPSCAPRNSKNYPRVYESKLF